MSEQVAQASQPCSGCGAPLAADQRYCMYCGTRRPEARLDFLDALADDQRATPSIAPPPPAPPGLLQANSGALALAAVVLTTLLIGLLVGHWVASDDRSTAKAPAPQVIRITGAAPAATTPATAAPTTTAAPPTETTAKQPSSTAKDTGGAKDVKKLSKKQLDNAVKKGAPISTGSGAAPKKDNKPAGNGTSFETIG